MTRLAAAILAALAAPALADAEQPTVVVTATRSAQTVDDTLASVTVLTRDDIARSQAPDLLELLRVQPGIDLARTGGPGQSTSLFLRGTNSNHTLFLIDGVRVASSGQGLYDLAHLPLEQIERIEIVRGPRASLWGSDAIGGVVQVFTRKPQGLAADARAGRYGRRGGSASYGAHGERGSFGVTLGGEAVDGFSATNARAFGHDPDDDGYHNRNLSLRGEARLGSQRLAASALSTDADVEFDQGETEAKDRTLAVTLGGELSARWSHNATLGYARGELETPAFGSRFVSRRETLDWHHDLDLGGGHALGFGVNVLHEQGRSQDLFAAADVYDESRNNRALYLGHAFRGEQLDGEVAARYDDNSAFGTETTFQAALGWRFDPRWRTFASFGEGFRAPSLNELYSPGFGGLFAGNPTLDPERSRSAELGVDYRFATSQTVTLRAFRTRVRDLIAFEGGDTFQAVNVRRAAIDGAELVYDWRGAQAGMNLSYTYQDPTDEETGLELLRRPLNKLAGNASWRFAAGPELGIEALYAGERRDFDGDLPSYAVANLRLSWPISAQWRLDARVDNAFDREYELASGYNTSDRAWMIAINYAAE